MNIDTLSIARDLKAAELPTEQAEAIAAAIGRSVTDSVPSKSDLEQVRGALELKIEQLRTEMERSHNQLFVRLVGTQTALAGLVVAAIKLL